MRTFSIILVTLLLTACGGGMNHNAHMGVAVATPDLEAQPAAESNGIAIGDSWARKAAKGDISAAYMAITNATTADTLVSATGDIATSIELHTVVNENGMMQMIPAEGGVPIDANGTQILKPGSFHIMLIGLRKDLKSGDSFPLTLTFANAGPIAVMFEVR
ncbi:MAG: copper chaperone PCu(A)C [Chloroflexi bacterium]|nr:MAG: copper chaperone PCu(A)C [Chloroflexota bacterium]